MNDRKKTKMMLGIFFLYFIFITCAGIVFYDKAMVTDFSRKNIPPGFPHLFGTDWMGRDMLARTLTGLSISILTGLLAASISAVIAFFLGVMAAIGGKKADAIVSFLIDAIMGIPHILLLILISYSMGKGIKGVVAGVALTHWISLARVIRTEVLQLKNSTYIQISHRLGQSTKSIVVKHMLPHLLPQFVTGLVLMFPHAVLHEASITFLGFGLTAEQPAIGLILSESMKYLITGKWWLAVCPGVLLVLTILLFDLAGDYVRRLWDPCGE